MQASDDELILEHLAYIRAVAEEIRQDVKDVLAMFDGIERSMERMLASDT